MRFIKCTMANKSDGGQVFINPKLVAYLVPSQDTISIHMVGGRVYVVKNEGQDFSR